MKRPTKKDIADYEFSMAHNNFFWGIDAKLAENLTYEERVVVMKLIWPAVQDVASAVMHRTMRDLLKRT